MGNEEKKQGGEQKAWASLEICSRLAQALAQILSAIATVIKTLFG